ncbi:hypothetical protein [Leptolyngbya sp. 7M]|uniref:hypothetical protein n=1 Tax=Leptolyngbya sp. 7M TaxID=2812896 RepID=UPI001B8B8703|nr:hypothetical protein [Leptolyngbya sp. 7M]QYO61924.1 hypothetical protein JVX88_17475 [Leptolyngbya sp. 7M]
MGSPGWSAADRAWGDRRRRADVPGTAVGQAVAHGRSARDGGARSVVAPPVTRRGASPPDADTPGQPAHGRDLLHLRHARRAHAAGVREPATKSNRGPRGLGGGRVDRLWMGQRICLPMVVADSGGHRLPDPGAAEAVPAAPGVGTARQLVEPQRRRSARSARPDRGRVGRAWLRARKEHFIAVDHRYEHCSSGKL